MDGYIFRSLLAMIAPDYAIDVDNSGQIIIYTNLMETDNDQYIQWKDKGESNDTNNDNQ
jgi:hypothetical protein